MAGDIGIHEVAIVAPAGGTVPEDPHRLGTVSQRYGPRVVIAAPTQDQADYLVRETPHEVLADPGAERAPEMREDLTEAERLGLEAFVLRQSAEYAAAK